jgi:hypothetical protein
MGGNRRRDGDGGRGGPRRGIIRAMTDSWYSKSRRVRRVGSSVMAGALLLGAAACSKTETTSTTPSTQAPSGTTGSGSGGGSGTTTKGTTVDAAVNLNTTVWYEGFEFKLGKVTYDPTTTTGYQLTIATEVTNLSDQTATPYTNTLLQADNTQIATGSLKDVSGIVGGKTASNAFQFSVEPDEFDLANTVLVFGGQGKQEASVPLSGKGPVVNLEPISQAEFTKPIVLGQVTVQVQEAEVRFDLPDHTEADAGKAFLVLSGTVKNAGESTAYLSTTGLTITSSDGEEYTAQHITPGSVQPSQSDDKFQTYFEIKWPSEGTWTLNVKADWDGDGTEDTTTVTGNVTATSGGGTTATTKAG